MRVYAFFASIALTLAGCAELEEQRIEEAKGACTEFGFEPGTPQHAECAARQYALEEDRRRAAGLALAQAAQNAQATIVPRRVNCTSHRVGTTVQTYCY